MDRDQFYMRRCLQLARRGAGYVSPNPMVGAVVVCQDRIIGEGYHRRCGEAHAEVNAIGAVQDERLLSRSTLYVSLEPCAHYGKTPPCAELIVRKKIPRVVVGCLDPFEKVSGRGVQLLRDAGVEVVTGVLEKECLELNRFFMFAQKHRKPYVVLKWAQSADGYIDRNRIAADQPAERFSTPVSTTMVHRLRSEVDAICIGAGTARLDNPSLTVRCWSGKHPLRIVFDRNCTLPRTLQLFTDGLPTWVLTETDAADFGDVRFLKSEIKNPTLSDWLDLLTKYQIQSLLVEGGGELLQRFIDEGCWNEARVEVSEKRIGSGISAPELNRFPVEIQPLDSTRIYGFRNPKGDLGYKK